MLVTFKFNWLLVRFKTVLCLSYAPVTHIEEMITAVKANIFWLDFKLLVSRLYQQISQIFVKNIMMRN
jgi:hypothetical protein